MPDSEKGMNGLPKPCRSGYLTPTRSGELLMKQIGDEWEAYGALGRTTKTDHVIAYGGRPLWQRSRNSSRRSHARPRQSGKLATGRSATGVFDD